jgi:transcriptional regulator with XRE-family HTH domain
MKTTNEFTSYVKMNSMMINQEFINWLWSEINNRKWGQIDLAKASGLSRGAVGNVLRGERSPGKIFLIKIAKGLGYPPEFVYRKAGLFPQDPKSDENAILEQWKYYLFQLPQQDRDELLRIAQIKVEYQIKSQEREKSQKLEGIA